MKILSRLLGVVVLVLSSVVFIACVAGIVGSWRIRRDISGKVEDIARQFDAGLRGATAATYTVDESMTTARDEVRKVDPYPQSLEPGGFNNQTVTRYLRTVTKRLSRFSDAATSASSMLHELRKSMHGPAGRIDLDKNDRASQLASQLSANVQALKTTLGKEGEEVTGKQLVLAAQEMESALKQTDEMLKSWRTDLDAVGAVLPDLKSRVLGWLTPSTLLITVLLAWAGIGQISLFTHGWRWCRAT